MNIETPELDFEEISYKDLEKVHRLYKNPEVNRFNTIGTPKSLDETNEIIQIPILDQYNKNRKYFTWRIILKYSKDFIGIAELKRNIDVFRKAEIAVYLEPNYWNKGYGTASIQAMMNFGFEALMLHRLEAVIATENQSAIRIYEKAGFEKEGVMRRNLPIHKVWTDSYLYAILAEEKED